MGKDAFFQQVIYFVYALNTFSLMLSSRIKKRYVNVYNYNRLGKSNPHCQTNQPMKILLQKKGKGLNHQINLLILPIQYPHSFLGSDKEKEEGRWRRRTTWHKATTK